MSSKGQCKQCKLNTIFVGTQCLDCYFPKKPCVGCNKKISADSSETMCWDCNRRAKCLRCNNIFISYNYVNGKCPSCANNTTSATTASATTASATTASATPASATPASATPASATPASATTTSTTNSATEIKYISFKRVKQKGFGFILEGNIREAIEHYQQAVKDFEKNLGPEHEYTLFIINTLEGLLRIEKPKCIMPVFDK